jgi:hypothetical protein
LPWFCANSGVLIQEESFLEIKSFFIPEFQERLINLIIANNVAFERLLLQFSGNFIVQLISLIVSGRSGLKADLIPTEKAVVTVQVPLNEPLKERVTEMTDILHRILKKLESDHAFASLPVRKLQCDFLRKAIQKIIFLNEPLNHESIHLLLEEMKSNALKYYSGESGSLFEDKIKGNMVFLESQEKKLPEKLQKEKDDFFVQHAGLVLLHPFLEYFFKDFNLLKDGQFRNRDAQIMGVHLLHFLATKDELAAEHAMLFEKFLCGVEPGDPIDRFITLSQEMKDEGENLLRAVIGHWKALKNTSPDGLREGFLQRDGSLALDDFQNRLIVESKAQDVLLSFLPWGFSYFKLPWMECALNVEWQQAF